MLVGKLCAFLTETIYGLGADATDADAVVSIYETNGRPRFNPLIIHCADLAMAETLALFSPLAHRVAALWPRSLTLVLPARPGNGLADMATAGLDTVAIRIPDHPLALALLAAVGRSLAGVIGQSPGAAVVHHCRAGPNRLCRNCVGVGWRALLGGRRIHHCPGRS